MNNSVNFRDPREFTYIFSPLYSAQPGKFKYLLELFALLANLNKPIELYMIPDFDSIEKFLRRPQMKPEPAPEPEVPMVTIHPTAEISNQTTQTTSPSENQDQETPPDLEGRRGRPKRT